MNSKLVFAIVAIVFAVGLVAAATVSAPGSAFAAGGPKAEKNFGQCKKNFNEKPCSNFHTGN